MTGLVHVVALLALLNFQLVSADLDRYYVHPLFDQVAVLPNPTQGSYMVEIIYKQHNESVVNNPTAFVRRLKIYRAHDYDLELYRHVSESNFETGLPGSEYVKDVYIPIRNLVSDERKRIRSYKNKDCLEQSFRAFELIAWKPNEGRFIGVGMGQGPGLCVIRYKGNASFKNSNDIFMNIENVQLIDGPATAYRVASIAGLGSPIGGNDRNFNIFFIDEAGYSYIYNLKENENGQFYLIYSSSYSLGSHALEKSISGPFGDPAFESYMLAEGLSQKMKTHFDHCLTEAITIYRDLLIHARGVDPLDQPRLRAVSASSNISAFMFHELIRSPSKSEKFVNALEMYDHAGQVNLHIVISRRLENAPIKRLKSDPEYYYCNFVSIDLFRSIYSGNDKLEYLKEIQDKDITCVKGKLYRDLMPIDIVHMPHCSRTVFFYEHWYYEIEVNKVFDGANEQKLEKKFINWMHRPINAILYNNRRLYLFLHGSDVMISKPHDACTWEDVEFEPVTYTQSQLILQFKNDPLAQQAPLFMSDRSSYAENSAGTFRTFPSLETVSTVNDALKFQVNPEAGPNGTSTTTTPKPSISTPKPGPRPGSTKTSIIIIATIIIMILAAALFAVYYFCCGTTDELPVRRRQKSSLLQSRKTIRSEADKKPTPAPGSALTSAPTVRSDITWPSGLAGKSAIKSTSPISAKAASKSKEILGGKHSSPKSVLHSKELNQSKISTPPKSKHGSKIEKPASASPSPKSKTSPASKSKTSQGPKSKTSPGPKSKTSPAAKTS